MVSHRFSDGQQFLRATSDVIDVVIDVLVYKRHW